MKLKVVVLHEPIRSWHDREVRELFDQMVGLKLAGYGGEYPEGVISLDGTDFYADHLLLCRETSAGQLTLVAAYKSVSHLTTRFYRGVFPAFTTLRTSGLADQEGLVQEILDRADRRNAAVTYDSSWTMRAEFRRDRELSKEIRNIFTSVGVSLHADPLYREWLTCGVHRFKTNEYFEWMGLDPVTEPFHQASLAGEKVTLYHLKEFSRDALDMAERYRTFWDSRLILGSRTEEQAVEPMKKAA